MKRIMVVLSAFCILGVSALAVAPTNFSGTWVLDKTKSTGLQGRMANADVTMTVTQDGKQILVDTKITMDGQTRPSQPVAYKADGTESTMDLQGQMPGKATLKAKWLDGGKAVELTQVRNVNMQGNDVTITIVDHWELGEGGKTLKVHRSQDSPRGKTESDLVFNKQ